MKDAGHVTAEVDPRGEGTRKYVLQEACFSQIGSVRALTGGVFRFGTLFYANNISYPSKY